MSCNDDKCIYRVITPSIGVVLSGGHTSLVRIFGIGQYELIGETVDDAIGEAFDKAAKILGLPYLEVLKLRNLQRTPGNPDRFPFKFLLRVKGSPSDFSFSEQSKTNVLYTARGKNLERDASLLSLQEKQDISASFQKAVFQDVVSKLKAALEQFPSKAIYVGGGVTQNEYLKKVFTQNFDLPIFWPKPHLSLDNAAMIAGLGFHIYQRNSMSELFTLKPETRIPFERKL